MTDLPTIDELLEDAAVLQDEYSDADVEELCALALRELEMPRVLPGPGRAEGPRDPAEGQPDILVQPTLFATDEEQAGHDLDLMASLFVSVPQVTILLEELLYQRLAPEGALVFACMLHLIGHDDHARFWWRFAAGAGVYGGAFCLFLHHRARSEHRDARHWRIQAKQIAALPGPRTTHTFELPGLLTANIGRTLLRECKQQDGNPQLPQDVVRALHRLVEETTPGPDPVTDRTAAENQRRVRDRAIDALRTLADAITDRRSRLPHPSTGHPDGATSATPSLRPAGHTARESPMPA
ncbi:hypothetical protein [Streptantibioticus silvisoli]|uniref:Uncharacterized protein n=1 Tax=Streptantibioticus silvisoli TaxID=2705255 RepID=A0ABT6W3P3_9ACTN|nr:hypothetical protein [Streptantibioticus silvisoli]MDI5964924.1 hypothetical protein [Streptantibioticus silvisoli]